MRRLPILVASILAGCGTSTDVESGELFRAAERGDLARVRALLEDGASPDDRGPRERTAITAAAYGGHRLVVRSLIEAGADVDAQDETRANPLLSTGETGDWEMLNELLPADPDLGRTNRFGGTALIPAADRGHVEVVRILTGTAIDVNHVNNLGWTALLEAVILGDGGRDHQDVVELLLDGGADPSIADRDGVTPLAHARERGYEEIVRMLESAAD